MKNVMAEQWASGDPHLDFSRGFLPAEDPLQFLSEEFHDWEDVATHLPKILVTDKLRSIVEGLPPFDLSQLRTEREFERALLIISFIGHAYVWAADGPIKRIPASLAIPWYRVSHHLNRPPVLSYASYALHNWRRDKPDDAIAVGNIVLNQNFSGGMDEEWFILIHVDIELKAAPALSSLIPAQHAVVHKDTAGLEKHVETIALSLRAMCRTLDRMPEKCDPYIYYSRVRPYIQGWKDNPALPDGLLYEGVKDYKGVPQKFRGETGAQSSILPAFDAALGIRHERDRLSTYLEEMRDYMPESHRNFIKRIEEGPSIRDYVISESKTHPALRDLYNECIGLIERFRRTHLEYAGRYIHQQSQRGFSNSTQVGTGGTPFMVYLSKHTDETAKYFI
jgi:indoleamine 2,3-dioxygenase